MRVRWTPSAADDLFDIVQYIQSDNPSAAASVGETLFEGCQGLSQFPQLGRVGRDPGSRELVFPGLPYVVVYEVHDDVVQILRIFHGSRYRR